MCMHCMAGAATMVGSASGVRAWLATRSWGWLTPRRLRAATIGLMSAALAGASLGIGGASAPPEHFRPAAHAPAVPSPADASQTAARR